METNYWQVAAGEGDRDYTIDVFLRFGVFFGGDASKGQYDPDYYDDESYAKIIAKEMNKGDKLVLKKPHGRKWEIIAVGEIKKEGKYEYFETFDDMDGWNVAHGRRVDWVIPKDKTIISGLRRGTVSRIKDKSVMETVNLLIKSGTPKLAEDIPLPQEIMTEENIIEKLIDDGLRPSDAEVLTDTFRRVQRLARYYYKNENKNKVLEHETRTFLIVPLLVALGWAEQQMKIEWRNIDIAFFRKAYKGKDENNPCIMILESKRLDQGLTYAEEDVKYYAKEYPHCKKLIVSNGCCYKLYERKDTKWENISYLNILKPRRKHPFEKNVRGAVKTFLGLMPSTFNV